MNNSYSRVVISFSAYLGIIAETYERLGTETGGILLGTVEGDTWYVLEAIDPGPNAVLRHAYFEYDTPYVNHLANKIARFYKKPIVLLGLWHRHPGSMDTFSSTDDGTNREYAAQSSHGAISGLINLDPNFRITMYHVSLPLQYRRIPVVIGDDSIPQELLALKRVEDFLPKHQEISSSRQNAQQGEGNGPSARGIGGKLLSLLRKGQSRPESTEDDFNPTSAQKITLSMLESETPYLDSQSTYKHSLSMHGDDVLIVLTALQQSSNYPRVIECLLHISDKKERLARINGVDMPYRLGIIENYIQQAIAGITNRQGRNTDEHTPRTPSDSAALRSVNRQNHDADEPITETQQAILDMIQSEKEYLDSQPHYQYKLRMRDNQGIISMTYLYQMPYYPRNIECILRVADRGKRTAQIDGTEFPYRPGIIGAYIAQAIAEAVQREGY